MKLVNWSYAKRYNIKAVFDEFPHIVVRFRQVGGYYFIFSMQGVTKDHVPGRRDYVQMEYLLNKELDLLDAYIGRRRRTQ